MKKSKVIVGIIVPIFTALIGIWGANSYNAKQNSEINISINNVLDSGNQQYSSTGDLQTSTKNLITAYEAANQELENLNLECNTLKTDTEQLQNEISELQKENAELKGVLEENKKLKDFLLQDDRYTSDLDKLVIVKPTTKKLSDLYLIDSWNYDVVSGIHDLYGDAHSVSYRFSTYTYPGKNAWAKYRLDSNYDIFNASIATTQNTGASALMSIEIYADDALIRRIDDIARETSLLKIDPPISVRNVNILTIKAIYWEGYENKSICYITDDSLSVVE